MPTFRLRWLGVGARLGVTCLLLVLLGGLAASVAFIWIHHQNRDETPGLSLLDLQGAYHGVEAPSPLREALAEGHPEELPHAARQALLAWLASGPERISRDYDSLDLGDTAPSELIAAHCLACHSRAEAATLGDGLVLDSWDSVRRVAFSKEINPPPMAILVTSTHAHATTLGAIGLVLALLLAFTRWPAALVSAVVVFMGLGLLADAGGWWLARSHVGFVYGIVAGGAAFNAGAVAAIAMVLGELWLPGGRATSAAS